MTHSATGRRRFTTGAGPRPRATFDAGRLTGDGGLPWLADADQALGLCAHLARCVPEWRHGPVHHSLLELVRQRVFQIACGYADQNDASTLGDVEDGVALAQLHRNAQGPPQSSGGTLR